MKFISARLSCHPNRFSRVVAAVVLVALSGSVPMPRLYAAPSDAPTLNAADINELLLKAIGNDNVPVKVVGEAIGEPLVRGDHAWINVLDDSGVAIGVYVPVSEARKVQLFGDYARRGDTVAVTGVFHAACPSHGGDPDVHGESVSVLRRGGPVDHPVSFERVTIGLSLSALALLAGLALRRKEATESN